ncbi:MAG: hypothetical protein AMXMBFR7_51560 [Planctomycetota bacterium]
MHTESTAAAVTLPVPSDAEIAAQFEALLPELNSRAERIGRAVARNSVDQEEAAAEVIAHAWLNFRSAARRGTWLLASQLAWVAWHTARSGRLAAGGSSVTDAMDPCAHRMGRAKVISLHRLLGASRRRPKLEFQQSEMARPDRVGRSLTTAEHDSPAERARVHLDWSAFAAQLSLRHQAILCGLAEGWEQREMAAALGVSPGRITQQKADLAALVTEQFGAEVEPPAR